MCNDKPIIGVHGWASVPNCRQAVWPSDTEKWHPCAFVDIGVHQDGLIHISELDNRFVEDPSDVVSVGDVVRVKVLNVDLDRRRIGLSRKQA